MIEELSNYVTDNVRLYLYKTIVFRKKLFVLIIIYKYYIIYLKSKNGDFEMRKRFSLLLKVLKMYTYI